MASFGGKWTSQPFAWRTTGSVGAFGEGHGEVQVAVTPAPGSENRGWASLAITPRGAFLTGRSGGDVGEVRLSPADVRKLRDDLSRLVDDSEVKAWGRV
jgi:hypothetical protein